MRDWPSIVPAASEEFYIVVNHYGRFGSAFAETDINRADYETAVADLISGQHSDPLRVIMFNPETNRSEDVSHAIAQEILRRLGIEDAACRQPWKTSLTAMSAKSPAGPAAGADVRSHPNFSDDYSFSIRGVLAFLSPCFCFGVASVSDECSPSSGLGW